MARSNASEGGGSTSFRREAEGEAAVAACGAKPEGLTSFCRMSRGMSAWRRMEKKHRKAKSERSQNPFIPTPMIRNPTTEIRRNRIVDRRHLRTEFENNSSALYASYQYRQTIPDRGPHLRLESGDTGPGWRRLAEQRGFEIVHEYSHRIGGARAKRPALDQVMAAAHRGI